MFDFTSSSGSSALRSPTSHGNLWPWNSDAPYELYVPKSSAELDEVLEMEPTSPLSPASTISPTDSDHSITPTSPLMSSFKSFWPTSRVSTTVPRLNTSAIQSQTTRRNTHHFVLALPSNQTFAERMAHRTTKSMSLTQQQRHTLGLEMAPSEQTQAVSEDIVQDEDVSMVSPPTDRPCQTTVWENSTTSPILGKIVGVPVQDDCDISAQNQTNNNSKYTHDDQTNKTTSSSKLQSRKSQLTSSAPQPRDTLRRQMSRQGGSRECTNTQSDRRSRSRSRPRAQPTTTSKIITRKSLSSFPTKIHIPDVRQQHLVNSIKHLGIPLVPLISVVTGLSHPNFPRSVLQYHLLTHEQLDSLAQWYHQTIDNERERYMYPAVIERPWTWSDERLQITARQAARRLLGSGAELRELDLVTKRRRFGRFIGLRGCESPVVAPVDEAEDDDEFDIDEEQHETLAEKMEREWRAALKKAEEEEKLQEKVWRGRW